MKRQLQDLMHMLHRPVESTVRSGQITLFQTSTEGNEKIVDIFESGQTFAEEVMFIDDQCYPINARATCDTELFYFDAQSFKAQLRQSNGYIFQ